MADISTYLAQIMAAVYGEDVRGSIHDAIDIINQVSEVVLTTGTAVTSASSSSTGFFEDSLYLNTNTWDLWKCVGTDSWNLEGNVEGNSITSIEKTSSAGLADTYTIHYNKEPDSTFVVTNGKDGNLWYRGINISGKDPSAHVYPTGIANANPNDSYLNPNEGAVYYCVTGGNPSTATWAYEFTMTGGGGADFLDDLSDVTITTPADGEILTYDSNSSQWINAEPDKAFVRYGGALNFADLATYASTYLTAAYEDTFFLMRTGGTIGIGEASAYWTTNFSDGDEIPADAHIAVININRGTMNPAVYKYDDFGGFVDISDKADIDDVPVTIKRTNVTVSAGGSVVIPESGTDSRIKATSTIVPVCDSQVKYTSITPGSGTVSIQMAEALSGATVGVVVFNY